MPKRVNKETKRADVASRAMVLFAERGFDRTSIREVTEVVGMGKGTFYDYFTDKTDLLLEVTRQLFMAWHKHIEDKLASVSNPMEKLSVLLNDTITLVEDFRTFMILYMEIWLLSINDQEYTAFMQEFASFLKNCRKMVSVVIDEAKSQGAIKQDVKSEELATTFVALIDGLCVHSMVLKKDLNLKKVVNSFLKNIKEGVQ